MHQSQPPSLPPHTHLRGWAGDSRANVTFWVPPGKCRASDIHNYTPVEFSDINSKAMALSAGPRSAGLLAGLW